MQAIALPPSCHSTFICIDLIDLHSNSLRKVIFHYPYFIEGEPGAEQWNNLPNFRPNKWVSQPKFEPWKLILQSQPSQFSYFSFLGLSTWIYVFNLKFYAFHNLRVIFLVIVLFFPFITSLSAFVTSELELSRLSFLISYTFLQSLPSI